MKFGFLLHSDQLILSSTTTCNIFPVFFLAFCNFWGVNMALLSFLNMCNTHVNMSHQLSVANKWQGLISLLFSLFFDQIVLKKAQKRIKTKKINNQRGHNKGSNRCMTTKRNTIVGLYNVLAHCHHPKTMIPYSFEHVKISYLSNFFWYSCKFPICRIFFINDQNRAPWFLYEYWYKNYQTCVNVP